MSSRDTILTRVESNLPEFSALPEITIETEHRDLFEQLKQWLETLHVTVIEIRQLSEIKDHISTEGRVVSTIEAIDAVEFVKDYAADPHDLENVEIAILPGFIAVAENGAIWLQEENMGHRVLPFIAQQLALVISRKNIVANMHRAYDLIAGLEYGFGVFIAGPSKTADIEQSLVLGAHGPKSMMVFVLND